MLIKYDADNIARFLSLTGAPLRVTTSMSALVVCTTGIAGFLLLVSFGINALDVSDRSIQLRNAYLTDLGAGAESEITPLPADGNGVAVILPHRVEQGELRFVNYRIRFDAPSSPTSKTPLALCVARWSSSATVWLDGQVLRQPPPGVAGLSDSYRPELMVLPPGMAQHSHVLDIRLRAVPGHVSGLSPVWLGDSTSIRQACQVSYERLRDSRVGNAYLMVFLGLIALAIAVLKRDLAAFYFALFAAAWCAHNIFLLVSWSSISESTWVAIRSATRPLPLLPIVLFVLTFTEQAKPRLQWGLLLLLVVSYLAFALLPAIYWPLWLTCLALVSIGFAAFCIFWLLRYGVQQRVFSVVFLSATLLVGLISVVIDVFRFLEWVPWSERSLSGLTFPMVALGMSALMLDRMMRFMKTEERSAEILQEELARQRAEMVGVYTTLQVQAEKIAVLQERKRIVRDMHDGLGSQLVSASALLGLAADASLPMKAMIDGALQELRSVLDVLSATPDLDDPDDDPVSLLLGKLRHRLGPVLKAQGIEIDWQTESLPQGFLAGDDQRLQLLRVLQEAFANVLKHSKARTVRLSTQVFNDRIVVELRDDGVGIDSDLAQVTSQPGSHGLSNMQTRAMDMGASLKIGNLSPGTSVRLTFPWPAEVQGPFV
jgi:signal transduction histidine kinase